ncbi:hypothetical protein HYV83_04180 [Candidatus Woesearchaeota archaeon]|nr:hypothetical protein [Candidatus Woesearchaeota archaeon]
MGKTSSEDAKRILSNTSPERAFWVNNGPILKSVIELATAAKKLTPQQFAHHANNAKNDFAKWAEDVIRDSELAKKLRQIKTREDLEKAVANRLGQLRKLLK